MRKHVAHLAFDHIEINRLVVLAANQRVATVRRNRDIGQVGPGPVTGKTPRLHRPACNRILLDRDQNVTQLGKSGSDDAACITLLVLNAVLDPVVSQIPDPRKTTDFTSQQMFAIGTDSGAIGTRIGMYPGIQRLFLLAAGN